MLNVAHVLIAAEMVFHIGPIHAQLTERTIPQCITISIYNTFTYAETSIGSSLIDLGKNSIPITARPRRHDLANTQTSRTIHTDARRAITQASTPLRSTDGRRAQ